MVLVEKKEEREADEALALDKAVSLLQKAREDEGVRRRRRRRRRRREEEEEGRWEVGGGSSS